MVPKYLQAPGQKRKLETAYAESQNEKQKEADQFLFSSARIFPSFFSRCGYHLGALFSCNGDDRPVTLGTRRSVESKSVAISNWQKANTKHFYFINISLSRIQNENKMF